MDAMHPHCEQSGSPPNWHGFTTVLKSAETIFVVRAKTHFSGELGGARNSFTSPSGISSLGYSFLNSIRLRTTSVRSVAERHSTGFAPRCGVKMLIHTFLTAGFGVQKSR